MLFWNSPLFNQNVNQLHPLVNPPNMAGAYNTLINTNDPRSAVGDCSKLGSIAERSWQQSQPFHEGSRTYNHFANNSNSFHEPNPISKWQQQAHQLPNQQKPDNQNLVDVNLQRSSCRYASVPLDPNFVPSTPINACFHNNARAQNVISSNNTHQFSNTKSGYDQDIVGILEKVATLSESTSNSYGHLNTQQTTFPVTPLTGPRLQESQFRPQPHRQSLPQLRQQQQTATPALPQPQAQPWLQQQTSPQSQPWLQQQTSPQQQTQLQLQKPLQLPRAHNNASTNQLLLVDEQHSPVLLPSSPASNFTSSITSPASFPCTPDSNCNNGINQISNTSPELTSNSIQAQYATNLAARQVQQQYIQESPLTEYNLPGVLVNNEYECQLLTPPPPPPPPPPPSLPPPPPPPYHLVAGKFGNQQQHQQLPAPGGGAPLASNNVAVPHCAGIISPTSDTAVEMKYETQSGPPTAQPHLTSSGVEPPHSSQGTGIVVGGSPADAEDVSALLLPWGAAGPDFLETADVKQTAAGLQDAWDSILSMGTSVVQSMAELKPLPPFTGYTGHLSINGIQGHHYHTIASSAQRSISSASPTPSSNQEYYESPVVSSSTPCPQGSQKQPQQQHNNQQPQQQPQHHQHHQQPPQQQQPPQSTQQVEYDMEDIAEIISSAIADTTVPSGGNGPSSEHDQDASREWIDIADWIDTACSPKTQETTSPGPYSQIYVTTPSTQAQQHGSTLQSLLTQAYSPLLQARLQAGNTGIQNASCGETPSSTSPYPPVSPPGRVSTSCSPDHHLHSSYAAPSHPRKRTRSTPGSQNSAKKSPGTGTTAISYGTIDPSVSGKEKPVHRCHICNRGFLNKSNIKVHLRTHTGEKPFRCDVCAKAFRQKAHLIKHQQIHKRLSRE